LHLHPGIVFFVLEVSAKKCTKIVLGIFGCEEDEHGSEFVEDVHEFSGVVGDFVGD